MEMREIARDANEGVQPAAPAGGPLVPSLDLAKTKEL